MPAARSSSSRTAARAWCAHRSRSALAEAIDALFALSAKALRDMGEQGRARVAPITWDAVVEALAGTPE